MKTLLRALSLAAILSLTACAWAAESEFKEEPRRAKAEPRLDLERLELERILDDLRAELKALVAANKADEAQRVKQKIGELERELQRIAPAPERREIAEMEEQLQRMAAKIKDLRQLGRTEDADRLERERAELKERFLALRERGEGLRREGDPKAEQERRIQHIRIAVENLHAAGMHDLAERLAREVKTMDRLERLEAEVRELRQIIRELQRRQPEPAPQR
jgi:TolA-binding protein